MIDLTLSFCWLFYAHATSSTPSTIQRLNQHPSWSPLTKSSIGSTKKISSVMNWKWGHSVSDIQWSGRMVAYPGGDSLFFMWPMNLNNWINYFQVHFVSYEVCHFFWMRNRGTETVLETFPTFEKMNFSQWKNQMFLAINLTKEFTKGLEQKTG